MNRFKLTPAFFLFVVFASATLPGAFAAAEERLGLLIIGHGSPRDSWNESFMAFGLRVAEPALRKKQFAAVRTVFMEFASPTIADGLRDLQAEGCQAVVAVPAFVTVGHHTLFDVPAALGIFYSEHSVNHLAEHGRPLARPKIPVLYTAPLDEGDLLENYALWEIRQLSRDPKNEAIVFLIHGDAEQRPLLERRLRTLTNVCCGQTGITYADHAYIGVGQGFEHHGVPVLLKASEARSRTLVVGLYMTLSAEAIFRQAVSRSPRLAETLQSHDIVFSKRSLIEFPETINHLLRIAEQAASVRQTH
jgi:hypothetical protein